MIQGLNLKQSNSATDKFGKMLSRTFQKEKTFTVETNKYLYVHLWTILSDYIRHALCNISLL